MDLISDKKNNTLVPSLHASLLLLSSRYFVSYTSIPDWALISAHKGIAPHTIEIAIVFSVITAGMASLGHLICVKLLTRRTKYT